MGKKLPPEQLALYNRIDEILWTDWNPIGISGSKEGRDEYYGYLPHVFHMVLENASSATIANYLYNVATERMGLTCTLADYMPVAEKLHSLNKKA